MPSKYLMRIIQVP